MFRKIHSNRNPQDTLWSWLSAEFSVYLHKVSSKIKWLLHTYPNQAFSLMVLLLLGSMLFMLTFGHTVKPEAPAVSPKPISSPAQNGLSQILTQADAIRESLRLKDQITALIDKDSLTHSDSIRLEKAIDRLHQLTIKTSSP